ncbi:MAG: head GIN domain-containing protein [Chitinophagaceae bacterium]
MKRTLVLLFGLMLILSSCHSFEGERVKGDGNITSETRSGITGFEGVDVSGSIELHVLQGDFNVKIETDKNLQEHVEVIKDGSRLKVRPARRTSLHPSGKIKVYVSAPTLKYIGASGACTVISEGRITTGEVMEIELSGASNANLDIKALNVEVDASGACEITLRGESKNLSIDGSGSTSVRAFDLLAENTDVELSGAGDVEVFASVKLDAHTSGASSIRYKGNATVSQHVSGAGSVKKVD